MKFHYRIKVALASMLIFVSLISKAQGFDHSQQSWTNLLKKYTATKGQSTVVKYKEWKSQPSELNSYLKSVEAVTKNEFIKFTRQEQLAFLINAYNAFTVKLILENYPVKSIKNIGGVFSGPWKKKFFKLFGNETNLDWIEHEKIKKQKKEK